MKSFCENILMLGLLTFLLTPGDVSAGSFPGESFGWFASRVDYVGETSSCSPGQAMIELSLAEYSSTSTYTGNIGDWTFNIKDENNNIIVTKSYSGVSKSDQICFDPTNDRLQIIFKETPDTYSLLSPAMSVESDMSSMAGHIFRGYAHLRTKASVNDSNISGVYPDGDALKITPNFLVQTNEIPSIYSSAVLKSIKIYAYNASNFDVKSVNTPTSGGVGVREVSGMPSLNDGPYFWYFHQNFNGFNLTKKPESALNWTFESLPTTGVTEPLSFFIDTKPPEVNTIVYPIRTVKASGPNSVELEIEVNVQDLISGLAQSRVVIRNRGTETIEAETDYSFTGQTDLMKIKFKVDVTHSKWYTITHEQTDRAGNISATSTDFWAPTVSSLLAPTLESRGPTDIRTYSANIPSYLSSNGNSQVLERGTCWALDPNDLTDDVSGSNCMNETSDQRYLWTGPFGFMHTGLSASTTIYYRGYARNSVATGYSPINSFDTKPLGNYTLPIPSLPTIGSIYFSSTTADQVRAGLRYDDTGGSIVTQRALCWATSEALLPLYPTVDMTNCSVNNSVLSYPHGLPVWYIIYFYGLPSNSLIYFRGYVTNAVGTVTMTNSMRTEKQSLDIMQPELITAYNYSPLTKKYDLSFVVRARDLSNYLPSYPTNLPDLPIRVVPYTAYLKRINDGVIVKNLNGNVDAYDIYSALPSTPTTFADIDPGLYELVIEVNNPESLYAERAASSTAGSNNIRVKLFNFTSSDSPGEGTDGDSGGSGPIPFDPGLELYLDRTIARSGTPTNLYWNINLPYSMDCKIQGGGDFGPDSTFSFDPAIDGQTGSVTLTKLNNSQDFLLSCFEPVTASTFTTYATTTVTGSYTQM